MVARAFNVVAVLALSGTALASYGSMTYFSGHDARKCTPTDDRCAGAAGKPYVMYAPCCDSSKVCMADESKSWGSFCVDPPADSAKCYKTDQRCMGAAGHEYVHYKACCCPTDSCMEDAAMGWGSFCKPHGGKDYGTPTKAPATTTPCPTTTEKATDPPAKPYKKHDGDYYTEAPATTTPCPTTTEMVTDPPTESYYGTEPPMTSPDY
jgi:hypothetical protein